MGLLPESVVPQYFQAYIQHVCPIRPRTCRTGLHVNVPPREIQMKRLEFLDTLPSGSRGLALELLDEERLDDVQFLAESAETFDRYEKLFQHVDQVDRVFQPPPGPDSV
jgi:hypothetical protein